MKIQSLALSLLIASISVFGNQKAVEIATAAEFAQIKQDPWGSYYLSRDIDFKGRALESIDFCGTFDGKRFSVRNFKVANINGVGYGLFKSIGSGKCRERNTIPSPLVKNLIIAVDSIKGADFVGSLAGSIVHSSIINVKAFANLQGRTFVGGIAGKIDSLTMMENIEFTGEIRGHSKLGGIVGGVGYSAIFDGYSNAKIFGKSSIGGIAGYAQNSFIASVISDGDIFGADTIGGIIGVADGSISRLPKSSANISRAITLLTKIKQNTYTFEPQHRFIKIPELLGDENDEYIDMEDSIRLALRIIGTSTLSHISGEMNIGGVIGITKQSPWSTVESIFSGTVSGISKVGKYCGSCEFLSPIQLFIDAGTLNCTESCVNPLGNTTSDVINYHCFDPALGGHEIEYLKELAKQHFTPYHWYPTDHFGGVYYLQESKSDSLSYIYIDSSGAVHTDSFLVPAKGLMVANSKYQNRHKRDTGAIKHFVRVFQYPNVPVRPIRKIKLIEGGNSVSLRSSFLGNTYDSLQFSLIGDTSCFHLSGDTISMRCCPEHTKASTILQVKSWRRFSLNIKLSSTGKGSNCIANAGNKE